jgi:hypothetical protein
MATTLLTPTEIFELPGSGLQIAMREIAALLD